MSEPGVAERSKLLAEKRLRLMEVWESLRCEALPLWPAHVTILDERVAECLRNPSEVPSRDVVMNEARLIGRGL